MPVRDEFSGEIAFYETINILSENSWYIQQLENLPGQRPQHLAVAICVPPGKPIVFI